MIVSGPCGHVAKGPNRIVGLTMDPTPPMGQAAKGPDPEASVAVQLPKFFRAVYKNKSGKAYPTSNPCTGIC